jgi:prolyl oligopeptidase
MKLVLQVDWFQILAGITKWTLEERMDTVEKLRNRILGATTLTLIIAFISGCADTTAPQKPPETQIDTVVEVLHGTEVSDPYRWLEAQESEKTRTWIDAQNQYADSFLRNRPGREVLMQRISRLMKVDSIEVPMFKGGRYFFSKRLADQDLGILYMRRGLDGPDRVLVDPHELSSDHTTSVELMDVSEDGNLVAYAIRKGGIDEVSIRVFDVESWKDLPDVLPAGRYMTISITPDEKGLYYSRHDQQEGPRVLFHQFGEDPGRDRLVFGEGYGPEKIIASSLSPDGRYLLVTVLYGSAPKKTELHLKEVAKDRPFVAVVADLEARFSADFAGSDLIIRTDWKAPNERVFKTSSDRPSREAWKEIVAERKDAMIDSLSVAGKQILVNYLKDVQPYLVFFDTDGRELRTIQFDTIGSIDEISAQWDSSELFFAHSTFHIPPTIYRYDIETGSREVWARLDVPIESDRYQVEQVWYRSEDGTAVPMFLFHKKGIELDGSQPTLLTGYGGFAISRTPAFSTLAVAWVESGAVYALANLRGGGEFGERWHEAGMRENKQNVFDDFIAAAEWLIQKKYTQPKKLAIAGGSNGGLLVAAAMTQRPSLFGAVVCTYPLLDMIRYHQFLVARFWVPEYGSSEDPEQFRYIHAYSPYHQVREGTEYPAVLLITGDGDTRVDPLHARKMTALLQASTGSSKPVLLRYHTKAGHSGGRPVSERILDLTDMLSFLFWQLGAE